MRSNTVPDSTRFHPIPQELKDRIMAYIDDINFDPVVHKWTYKLKLQQAA